MAFTYIFRRVEKKYMLTAQQYDYIMSRIADRMHVDDYGESQINNIYFDNTDDELIETSLQKPAYKEKLRLRAYGEPTLESTVFFEIKKKYKSVVYKRRVSMSLREAYDYIENGNLPEHLEGNIPQEIDYMVRRYDLRPKAYIGYRRIAMVSNDDPELRITFDRDLTARYDDLRLEHGAHGDAILPDDVCLMEIKIPGAMPLWLAHILSEGAIFPHSFSKFGNAHIRHKFGLRTA